MDGKTLDVILGRFDRLDKKFDDQAAEVSDMKSRLTAVETKLDPVINDAKFKSRLQLVTHAAASAIGAGLMIAFRAIWPASVPPPTILHK